MGQETYKMNPEQLAMPHKSDENTGASLKESTLVLKSGMKVFKNYNSLNKTEIPESTAIEESEGKAIPYIKLTNKCRMNHGMKKMPI